MQASHHYPLKLTAGSFLLLSCLNVHAAGYQILGGINYENPAMMGFVHQMEFELGDDLSHVDIGFTGSTGPFSGSAVSDQTDSFAHVKFAYRVTPKIVVGINVTQPAIADVYFPIDSFVQFNTTGTYFKDVDISPRVSYQVTDNFNIGAGFNINYNYDGELSFVVPPNGNLVNTQHAWIHAFGYNLGMTYFLCKTTILGLSYYSKIGPYSGDTGVSSWGPLTNTHTTNNVILPAVWTANAVHFFDKKWLVSGSIYYAMFSSMPGILQLNNTAIGQINIPYYLKNAVSFQIGTKYDFCENWAVVAGFMYNSAIQPPEWELIGLPLYAVNSVGIGPELTFQKNWTVKAGYAYGWGNLHYHNNGAVGPINGDSTIRVNAVTLALNFKS